MKRRSRHDFNRIRMAKQAESLTGEVIKPFVHRRHRTNKEPKVEKYHKLLIYKNKKNKLKEKDLCQV